MENNLENLSEEEQIKLIVKTLRKTNQDIKDINKDIRDTISYCNGLDNFARKYPELVYNILTYKN
jgi:23S rRNA C2498 (ribose-2'-O)-methylase RlmM